MGAGALLLAPDLRLPAADRRRRPGARAPRRHARPRRHRRLRRRREPAPRPTSTPLRDAAEAAAVALRRPHRRRRRAAARQHHLPRLARGEGGDAGDRARPRRHLRLRRRRVQFGQGRRQPRARRDGARPARRPGDPRLLPVERDRGRPRARFATAYAAMAERLRPPGRLTPHPHDAEPARSISTTRRPRPATRAWWRRCCPGSPSASATRTAPSTRSAARPRRRWRRPAPRSRR